MLLLKAQAVREKVREEVRVEVWEEVLGSVLVMLVNALLYPLVRQRDIGFIDQLIVLK